MQPHLGDFLIVYFVLPQVTDIFIVEESNTDHAHIQYYGSN